MEVKTAQQEMRTVLLGGSVGQAVSGLIWLVSALLATFVSTRYGIIVLVLGGMFIFPLTQLVVKLIRGSAAIRKENPFNALAMQTAFIVPLCLPLIGAAALHNINWFYPAFMIVVGAHYLPFVTLYGMRAFAVLGAVLIAAGVAIGMYVPEPFSLGGWVTSAALLIFAAYAWRTQVAKK